MIEGKILNREAKYLGKICQTDNGIAKQFAWNTFEIDDRKYKSTPF